MDGRTALDALPAAALRCDAAGWITAVNPRCAALFAAGEELLRGSALATLFPNERDAEARLRRSAGESIRLQGRRLTGAAFYVEAQASVGADGLLTCRLWDVLGAASVPARASGSAARTA